MYSVNLGQFSQQKNKPLAWADLLHITIANTCIIQTTIYQQNVNSINY